MTGCPDAAHDRPVTQAEIEAEQAVPLPDRVHTSRPLWDWLRRLYERGYREA